MKKNFFIFWKQKHSASQAKPEKKGPEMKPKVQKGVC